MTPKEYKQMMDYLTRPAKMPGKMKVAQLDNVNTPDLDQTPDSILRPGETLEDFDVTFRRPNADGGRIGFSEGTDNLTEAKKAVQEAREALTKAQKIAQGLEKKRVSIKLDVYKKVVNDHNKAIKEAFDNNDASKIPKSFAQTLKEKGLKDGTYHYLSRNQQIPEARDVSQARFDLANDIINDYNMNESKFIEKETLLKKANFTPKQIKVLSTQKRPLGGHSQRQYLQMQEKLTKAHTAADKVRFAMRKIFDSPLEDTKDVKNFFNPNKLLSEITGLNPNTVSKVLPTVERGLLKPELDIYKALGNADYQNIIKSNLDFQNATLGDIKKLIAADKEKGLKPFSNYVGSKKGEYAETRRKKVTKAKVKAGEGVADINKAQDEVVTLLNKFYKENPQELLGNTKLRNLLDLTLKDGELVKKNKYVSDDDFLKLLKEKKGLFTIDHVDEVQFEKLSTEFPIFKQLATYNTNSGLIKSIKSYVTKNQNSKDPVVQDKIKKQIAFLEDLKLRVDTPRGRVGSKEILAAVDRQAGVLPNFLAQLKALNIKLPGKAKAALLGIGGGLGATTLASAGPIEETGSTAMDTAKTVGAAGTGVAAVGTKTGRNILGKAFRTLGTPLAGATFAANQIRSNIKAGENVADAVLDPLVGLELSFPGLFKENVAKITKNPILRRALSLGKFGRALTPIGAGITAAGLGIDAAKFTKKRIEELRSMTPEQRAELRRQGEAQAFDPFQAAEGGLIGKKSGPPPISGPTPHGDEGLPAAFKRVKKG
jgi:hypothetical protein